MRNRRNAIGPDDKQLIDRLYTHVDRLAGLIGPRHVGRPEGLSAAEKLIEKELSSAGDAVERQTYIAGDIEVANLIVERPGVKRPDEIVILGAHYDTVEFTPGADDNASAIAVLIEVARMLGGRSFDRTVRFIAFACEEPPHFYTETMGSAMYARRCRRRNERIVGMLCLEMVGYYCDEPGSQRVLDEIPLFLRCAFPATGNFLAAVGNLRSVRLGWRFRRGFKKASSFPLYSIALPEAVHAIRLSDHSSFWDQRYPALMLTDTSFLRNPHYHLPSDTPETLDYERMAEVTLGVAGGKSLTSRSHGSMSLSRAPVVHHRFRNNRCGDIVHVSS